MTLKVGTTKVSTIDTTKINEEQKKATEAKETAQAKKTEESQKMASGQSSKEIKEELDALKKEREKEMKKMEKIEQEMQQLAEDAADKMEEAAKLQSTAELEYKNDSKKVLNDEIAKYIEANKEGGDGMTRQQLAANIKNGMPTSNLGEIFALLSESNEQLGQIDTLLVSLNSSISDVKLLDIDIETMTARYNSAVAAERKPDPPKCCDPIGFTTQGKNGAQIRYDFIVDDGKFDTTSDLLGAENQWADMTKLDSSKDGIVSAQELSESNIKLVKTNPDGSQKIVDIQKEFGSDFSIDLNSYKNGGSHSAIDTNADFDNDGVKDQNLLGTFSINTGSQTITGYNTLDDVDFLEKNYNIKNDTKTADVSDDLVSHVNFFTEYSEKAETMRSDLSNAYAIYGVSESMIDQIDKQISKEGNDKANAFLEKLKKEQEAEEAQEKKEAEEAKKAEEAEETEETEETETEEEKKKEEENQQ